MKCKKSRNSKYRKLLVVSQVRIIYKKKIRNYNLDTTADGRERGWEGRKVQENTRKKSIKAVNSEPIWHFVSHPRQSNRP
jgi:hypothetical protein